jgi:hypothetical protein
VGVVSAFHDSPAITDENRAHLRSAEEAVASYEAMDRVYVLQLELQALEKSRSAKATSFLKHKKRRVSRE